MAGTARNNLGLIEGFSAGEDGWDASDKANLRRLDSLAQAGVKDKDLNTPPGGPTDGDRYIVGPSPTGAWASKAGQIATWNSVSSAWDFYVPKKGWNVYVDDERLTYHYETAWGNDDVEFKAVRFGAKGDDSTDNATALQACADAAAAAGGGTIVLPQGKFRTSLPIKLKGTTSIRGAGRFCTILKGTDANQDIIRLQGTMHHASRLGVEGTGTAGTAIGIRHIGENEVGTPINVGNMVFDELEIVGTSSWGMDLRGGTPSNEIWETTMASVIIRSSVSGGSLHYGAGSSSPSLTCRGCNFSSRGFGTYGSEPMERGGVHLDTVTQASFIGCLWEPTNAVALSLLTCSSVVLSGGCKMTMFTENLLPGGTDDGHYFITTSGSCPGFVIDGMEFLRISNTVGPRLIKTDDNAGAGPCCKAMRIANAVVDTNFVTQSIQDIFLGAAGDELLVDNVIIVPSDTGVPRPLTVWNNVSSFDRRRIYQGVLSLPQGGWDKPHLTIGARHLFNDANGNLRSRWFNDSTNTTHPTTPTDGDLVATDNAYVTLENTTSPSVAVLNGGRNFKCSPAGATTITTFDDATNGQTIQIIFTNGNATISESGNIRLLGTGSFVGSADDVLVLTFDGTSWYEVSRSVN